MLSLLPGSMDPPLPLLPGQSAVDPPTASTIGSGSGGSRKRKLHPASDQPSTAFGAAYPAGTLPALSASTADSLWAGGVLPLPSTTLSLSAAIRSSTASTASSTPSPRSHSASSLHHSPAQRYQSLEAPVSLAAVTLTDTLPPRLADAQPASQTLPLPLPPPTIPLPAISALGVSSAAVVPPPMTSTPPFVVPQLPPPPPLPGVPPAFITRLMPTMQYSRIEPSIDQHYLVVDGDTLLGRYRVVRVLGRGTFSQVVHCRDMQAEEQLTSRENEGRVAASGTRSTDVAIKIVRAVERYRIAAEREARLLQSIQHKRHTRTSATTTTTTTATTATTAAASAETTSTVSVCGSDGCVVLLGSFMLTGHLCLVFPVLGLSLYDFLRLNHFRPLFPAHIRHIGYQLLQTCAYLHEECGVIHADIKPENVLFVDSSFQTIHIADMAINVPLSTAIRLIDFGTAVHRSSDHPALVVSRSYRSIEVVLGVGWGDGVDVWAVGCVLMELYTGQRLFNIGQGGDEVHLHQMQQLLGAIPHSLLSLPRVYPPASPPSQGGSPVASAGMVVGGVRLRDRVVAGDVKFCDLIERMLTFDPRLRITARQALQHPYFLDGD